MLFPSLHQHHMKRTLRISLQFFASLGNSWGIWPVCNPNVSNTRWKAATVYGISQIGIHGGLRLAVLIVQRLIKLIDQCPIDRFYMKVSQYKDKRWSVSNARSSKFDLSNVRCPLSNFLVFSIKLPFPNLVLCRYIGLQLSSPDRLAKALLNYHCPARMQ